MLLHLSSYVSFSTAKQENRSTPRIRSRNQKVQVGPTERKWNLRQAGRHFFRTRLLWQQFWRVTCARARALRGARKWIDIDWSRDRRTTSQGVTSAKKMAAKMSVFNRILQNRSSPEPARKARRCTCSSLRQALDACKPSGCLLPGGARFEKMVVLRWSTLALAKGNETQRHLRRESSRLVWPVRWPDPRGSFSCWEDKSIPA